MKALRPTFNGVVTAIFFVGLFIYFLNNRSDFEELLDISMFVLISLVVLKTVRIFANGLVTKFTLTAFEKNISLKETNYLSLITSLGNFFGPVLGGASVRAVYLKKIYKFQYSKFGSTLYGYYVIAMLTNSIIGIVTVLTLSTNDIQEIDFTRALSMLVIVLLLTLFLFFLPTSTLERFIKKVTFLPSGLLHNLSVANQGWATLRRNKKLIFNLFILNIAILSIATLESALLYPQFVQGHSFANVLLYTILGTMSILISITPGGLGVREALYLFTASALMLDSTTILQIAAIDRSITFILLFTLYAIVKLFKLDSKYYMNTVADSTS